jgi:hypothetical protein
VVQRELETELFQFLETKVEIYLKLLQKWISFTSRYCYAGSKPYYKISVTYSKLSCHQNNYLYYFILENEGCGNVILTHFSLQVSKETKLE